MFRRIVFLNEVSLLVLLVLLGRCSEETNPTDGDSSDKGYGAIAGRVVNLNGVIIPGVNIGTTPPTSNVLTSVEGVYTISNVPVGNYTVSAGKAGYQTESAQITVIADSTAHADFLLIRPVTPPSSVRLIAIVQSQWGKVVLSAVQRTGQNQMTITSDDFKDIAGVRWSHKREKIGFYGKLGDEYGVYMINADGTEQKKVGFPGISSDNISWSYDDQSLFFTGITTSQMRDYSIRRYAVSTGVISEISPRLSMPYGYPEASPRQNSVFYRDGTNMSLAELDLGSSRSYGGNGFRFRWSSDGLSVAYDNVGIYTLRLSDGARTIISADEGQGPKYSPDGTKIAYEFPSGTFKIVDSKSAQALYIIQTNGRYFCWSPDSPECAYDDMLGYLWVSSLDGQTKKRIASGVICFDW